MLHPAQVAELKSGGCLRFHVNIMHPLEKQITCKEKQRVSPSRSIMTAINFKNNDNKKIQNNSKNIRAMIIEYDSSPITSIKPLPDTIISKDFISRLNQLSSPITRKLKFWNKKSFQVNQYDPSFKVIYLGNIAMQFWSKDEGCLVKPLSTLWKNYVVHMKTDIVMRLTICNSGLKALTRQHGLTQYWSNRLVYCCSHKNYPRIFSWIYRHEGKKMRQELRCHAVFCPSAEKAAKMVTLLNQRLTRALQEFKREKKVREPTIVDDQPSSSSSSSQQRVPRTIPLRRRILAKGTANFRPPLERSKSAPKLTSIKEEDSDLEDVASHEDFNGLDEFLRKPQNTKIATNYRLRDANRDNLYDKFANVSLNDCIDRFLSILSLDADPSENKEKKRDIELMCQAIDVGNAGSSGQNSQN